MGEWTKRIPTPPPPHICDVPAFDSSEQMRGVAIGSIWTCACGRELEYRGSHYGATLFISVENKVKSRGWRWLR